MPRYSLKRLLLVVTAIAMVLAFLRSAYIHFTRVEYGRNVASVAWLPSSATNVSYYKSYSFTSYEFDISEAEFKAWAWWDTEPISTPICVMRYDYPTAEKQAYVEHSEGSYACVTDGLGYTYRQSNGGGIQVAYDRKLGRAFFHSSPR